MRKITLVLTSLLLASASPVLARSAGSLRLAEEAIISHRLLTPEQLACSTLVYGHKATQEAAQVIVLEKRSVRCPGDPSAPPRPRFSLFVDPISGAVQWDNPDPTILEDLPAPGEPPIQPSILTACGVCAHF